MKQLLIQTGNIPLLDSLSLEERGKLFTLLITMAADKVTQEQADEELRLFREFTTDNRLLTAFLPFKQDFECDKKRYDNIVARNRANGAKGGRPRKTQNPTGIKTQKTTIEGLSMINHNHNIYNITGASNFTPPTVEEVITEGAKLCISEAMCRRFHEYYSNPDIDWTISGRKMKSWQYKLSEWKNNPINSKTNGKFDTNHESFASDRNEAIRNATLAAIQSSQNGFTQEVDIDVL